MKELTNDQIDWLVSGFWNEIDGGYCSHCSEQAVNVLVDLFSNQKESILNAYNKIKED